MDTSRSSPSPGIQNVKCVVVGDGCVGKTCLIWVYAKDSFPREYIPTVFDSYSVNVKVDGQLYSLSLWDTAGQDAYDRLRPLSYPQTDAFLICFSTADAVSFHNIRSKWYPEIHHHAPGVPIILVGTKTDLRETVVAKEEVKTEAEAAEARKKSRWGTGSTVSTEEGKKLAKDIRARTYLECSALKLRGVVRVFHEAIYAGSSKPEKPELSTNQRKCRLL